MNTQAQTPVATPEHLAAIYAEFERHSGSHAPVALLVYCQGYPKPTGLTYILTGRLQRIIVGREVKLYQAREDDHVAHIVAYQECCDQVRKAIADLHVDP